VANEYCDRFKGLNFREYCNRVICIEVDEPLEKFERDYPPDFGATHEDSKAIALSIWKHK